MIGLHLASLARRLPLFALGVLSCAFLAACGLDAFFALVGGRKLRAKVLDVTLPFSLQIVAGAIGTHGRTRFFLNGY